MADLRRENDENKQRMIEAQKMYQEQVNQNDDLKTKVGKHENELISLKSSFGTRIDELTAKKASTDQLMKLEREVNDQEGKHKIKNNQLEESIRAVSSKLEQIEKV